MVSYINKKSSKKPKPIIFLVGTVIWSWFFYLPIYISDGAFFEFPNLIFAAIGGLGPLIVSIILVSIGYWSDNQETGWSFTKKSLNPLSMKPKWYISIISLILVLTFTPFLLEPSTIAKEGLFEFGPLTFIWVGAVFGGLEEIGWRGYAQETLQKKLSILTTSFIIGLFWAVWHLPLFFLEGTYQSNLGIGTPEFWAFNIAILIGSPIYAWIYNSLNGVTFSVVLFHGLGNVFGELTTSPTPTNTLLIDGITVLIIIYISWNWITKKK